MSESEVRAILRQVCERLARQVVMPVGKMAVPVALGAALAGGTGCFSDGGPSSTPIYSAPYDAVTEAGLDNVSTPDVGDPGSDVFPKDADDPGSVPLYMALDVAPPDSAYMGPDAGPSDPGAQPPYMAPDDPGPQPAYMAVDAVDTDPGSVPLYMAVDAGPTDPGALPPYMAPS